MKLFSEKNLHTFFEAGALLKACDSAIEMGLGLSFYFISTAAINRVIFALFGDELTEQPRDFIWNLLLHNFQGLSGGVQSLWAFLFVGHGILKLFLVGGMLKKKLWVYPVAAGAFLFFVLYQAYRIFLSPSVLLELLTAYDAAFTLLILHEYRYQRRALLTPSEP